MPPVFYPPIQVLLDFDNHQEFALTQTRNYITNTSTQETTCFRLKPND